MSESSNRLQKSRDWLRIKSESWFTKEREAREKKELNEWEMWRIKQMVFTKERDKEKEELNTKFTKERDKKKTRIQQMKNWIDGVYEEYKKGRIK